MAGEYRKAYWIVSNQRIMDFSQLIVERKHANVNAVGNKTKT